MEYYFKPSALRDLRRLPETVQKRIFDKLDFYTNSPEPLAFAKSLPGGEFGDFRFRIGDYRVIFDVEPGGAIVILAVGHRKDIYR